MSWTRKRMDPLFVYYGIHTLYSQSILQILLKDLWYTLSYFREPRRLISPNGGERPKNKYLRWSKSVLSTLLGLFQGVIQQTPSLVTGELFEVTMCGENRVNTFFRKSLFPVFLAPESRYPFG